MGHFALFTILSPIPVIREICLILPPKARTFLSIDLRVAKGRDNMSLGLFRPHSSLKNALLADWECFVAALQPKGKNEAHYFT